MKTSLYLILFLFNINNALFNMEELSQSKFLIKQELITSLNNKKLSVFVEKTNLNKALTNSELTKKELFIIIDYAINNYLEFLQKSWNMEQKHQQNYFEKNLTPFVKNKKTVIVNHLLQLNNKTVESIHQIPSCIFNGINTPVQLPDKNKITIILNKIFFENNSFYPKFPINLIKKCNLDKVLNNKIEYPQKVVDIIGETIDNYLTNNNLGIAQNAITWYVKAQIPLLIYEILKDATPHRNLIQM